MATKLDFSDFEPIDPSEYGGSGLDLSGFEDLDAGLGVTEVSPDDLMNAPLIPPEQRTHPAPEQADTDFQGLYEIPKGVIPGAVSAGGVALKGLSAVAGPADEYRAIIDEIGAVEPGSDQAVSGLRARTFGRDLSPTQRTGLRHALSAKLRGDSEPLQKLIERLPKPVTERALYRAGERVQSWGDKLMPAAPGYEASFGRQVGEGLGSLGAGVAASVIGGPITAGALFTAMGAGEAAERAIEAGASDEEVVRAAALGVGAGSTDVVPVEVLLGRLPVPGVRALAQAVRAVGGAEGAKAIGRIGVQAAVEGVQEGGQEFLQNVIAREVHSPDTVLAEGVLPGAGVGSAVGGIAGIGREGAMALFRRRSRSGRGVRAKAAEAIPEPTPEDEASPIPTETIQEGRRVVADADATTAADNILAAEGMPRVGTPVRVRVGQRSYEGIVTDAWGEAETAGISVTERDGTVIDSDLQELHDIGAELDILPTEYVDMDPELASVRAQTEALEAEATAQELDAAEAVIAEATQGLADLEAAETSLPTGQEEGTTGAPLLTPTEAARVAELARDGMAPEQAVEQVVAEKQDRAIPAEETEPAAVPDGGFPVSTTPVDADGGDQAGPSLPSDPQLTQDEVDEAADTSDLEGFEPVETETGEGWAPEPTAAGEDVAFGDEGPMGGTAAPEETIPRDDAEQGEAAPEPTPAPEPEPERIVKKDGTPFKSKGAASLVAKSKKLTDFEVVEVEGGYAIDSRPQTPVADEVDEGAPTGEPPAGASRATDEAVFEDEDTRPRPPIEEVDPLTLEVDPQAFQYKEGGDASGVTERLRGIKRWDQLKSGVAYVWERADGKRFIADGHQRVGLAKRLADQNPRLDVRIFKETDGYTPADLRERAAAKNIAEGSGTGWDAATVLRESNNPDSLMETLPPNSAIVRDARGLAKLDDELFAAAKADPDANPGHWAVIGEIGEGDRALQDLLVTSFRARKPKSIREAELQARLIQADRLENESQQSLFGSEDVAQSLYAEKARIMDTAIRRLSQDKRVFATLDRHATTIEAAGNRLAAGNSAIAQEAGQAAALVQQLGTMRGPVADVLSRAALEMRDGGTLEGAVRQFTEAVKSWDPIAGRQAGEVDDGGGREVPRGEAEEDTGGEAREPTAAELEAAGQQTFFQRDRLAALTGTPEDFAIAEEAMMQRARGDRETADLFGEDLHSQPPMDFGLFAQGEGAPKPPPAPKPNPETEVKPKTQTPDGTLDLFGTEPPADMKPVEPKKAPRRKRKTDPDIQDFGEKIEGARKDLFRELASTFDKSEAVDIATSPLSKSFPQLNYEKMLEAGHDRQRLMLYAVLRSAIPNKPRDRYYLRGWTESVETVRGEARRVMDPDVPLETIEAEVGAGPMATAEMLVDFEPKDWIQATKFRLTETQLRRDQGIPWQLRERGNPWYRDAYRTRDEAIRQGRDEVRGYIERQAAEKKGRSKYTKMSVYRNRKTEELYIGFRANGQVHRLKAGFADVQSAYEYLEANKDDLQSKIDQMRRGPEMRQGENRVRKGKKYRDADVSPEQFQDMFGFRGVQFGNYVEGKRRQQDINEAYDALMDMADALGIPPRSLSLDGTLGLAFGARGGGGGRSGAKAHYEPGQIVINLTKTAGPGSLAHEWLHALDNNFGRRAGREYLSDQAPVSGDMRPEVVAAWDATIDAIETSPFRSRSDKLDRARSKPYWGTPIEMAARSFERYIHDRLAASGFQNDYLVNINLEGGAYPTAEEMRDAGIADGFNKLFETVESRATDTGGQLLYQRDRGDTATGDLFAEPATPAAPATPARKPVSDTDATLARMRTKGPVNFTKPYVGKTGAQLVGYEWVWTPIETVDRRGEDRVLRVSDWERSITNPETNRQIVHHFFIETVNGEEREVSAETAAKLLGVTQSTVRRSAKKLLERAIAEAREEEAAVAYGEDLAQAQGYASPADAILEGRNIPSVTYARVVFERERNDARWWEGRGDINIRGREDLSFLEKDGRYLFSPGPHGAKNKEEMARRGWREVKIPRFRVFPKDGGQMLYQTAWHASPHEFDNFTTEAIGTGEGAQAYGWGLYFAESEEVANWYRDKFRRREGGGKTVRFNGKNYGPIDDPNAIREALTDIGVDDRNARAIASKMNGKESWARDILAASQNNLSEARERAAREVFGEEADRVLSDIEALEMGTSVGWLNERLSNRIRRLADKRYADEAGEITSQGDEVRAAVAAELDKLPLRLSPEGRAAVLEMDDWDRDTRSLAPLGYDLKQYNWSMQAIFNDAYRAMHNDPRLAKSEGVRAADDAANWVWNADRTSGDNAPLYRVELAPKEDEYLLWDKPLDQQPEPVKRAIEAQWRENFDKAKAMLDRDKSWPEDDLAAREFTPEVVRGLWEDRGDRSGRDFYKVLTIGVQGGPREASEALHRHGIRGIKYLDGMSRNRPLREIKREFIDQLPEDSDIADVEALIGTGAFSPQYDAVLKALQADDWLGFDYPSQAISAALSDNIRNWDASDALIEAVEAVKSQGTHNYVIFDESDVAIEEIMLQRRRGRQAPSAEGRARVRPTRRFNASKLAIRAEIETLGKRAFGENFNVRVADQIVTPEGDFATGAFDPNARVAYIALRDKADMTGTLYHEGLHYLRRAGAFTKKDGTPTASWKALEAEAPKWREKYRIDERYPAGSTEDLLIEEAIAEAIDDYTKNGPGEMSGKVKLAMDRVLAFFRRLGNVMRGRGFQTATDIFEGLQAGDFQTADGTPDAAAMDRYLQTAWHGSPHEFDRFSTEAIGTGEGAQAYGWGLYFTDKEEIARHYRDTLSKDDRLVAISDEEYEGIEPWVRIKLKEIATSGSSPQQKKYRGDTLARSMKAEFQKYRETYEKNKDKYDRGAAAVERIAESGDWEIAHKKARLYKVDLAPENNEYLVWDRPLSVQPKVVKDYVRWLWNERDNKTIDEVAAQEKPIMETIDRAGQIRFPNGTFMIIRSRDDAKPVMWKYATDQPGSPTNNKWKSGTVRQAKLDLSRVVKGLDKDPYTLGATLYRAAVAAVGGPRAASKSMLEHGIRGNKYLDGMSRSEGEGSYNYVIFDESDVAIEEVQFQRGRGPLADVNDPRVRNYMRDSYATVGEQKGAEPVVIWSGTRGGFFETWTPPNDYDRERAAVWGTTNRTVAASYGEDRIMEPPDPSTSGPVRADPEQVRESMEMDVDGLISFEMKWVRAHNQAGLLQPHPPRLPDAPLPFTVEDWVDAVRSSETPADVINERFPATKEDPVAKEFLQILEEELAGNLYQARRRQKWEQGNRAGMYPLVMNLQNPLVVDANGNYWDEIKRDDAEFTAPARGNETVSFSLDDLMTTEQITNAAKAEGFDGVIIKNVVDTADDIVNEPADVYVAFRPEQAKDLRAERFDEFEANMFLQRANPTERPLDFGLSGAAPAQFQLADGVKASAERFGAGGPVATQIAELLQPLIDSSDYKYEFARKAKESLWAARAIPLSIGHRTDSLRGILRSMKGDWPDLRWKNDLRGIDPDAETVEVSFLTEDGEGGHPVVGTILDLPDRNGRVKKGERRTQLTLSVDDIFMNNTHSVYSPKPLRDAFRDLEDFFDYRGKTPFESAGLSIDSPALREFMKGSYATANGERGGTPEVIYSGTHAGYFETFDPPDERDKRRAVAWGSTNIEVAATYSNGAKNFLTKEDLAIQNNPEWLAGYAEETYRDDLEFGLFEDEWHATASDFSEVDDQSRPPFTLDDWLNVMKDAGYKVDAAVAAMAERFTSGPEKAFAKNLGEIFTNEVNDVAHMTGGTAGVYPLVMNMENPLIVHAGGIKWNRIPFASEEAFDAPGETKDKGAILRKMQTELFGRTFTSSKDAKVYSPEELHEFLEKLWAAENKTSAAGRDVENANDELIAVKKRIIDEEGGADLNHPRIKEAESKLAEAVKAMDKADEEYKAAKLEYEISKSGSERPVPTSTSDIAYAAKSAGFDGVIFRNVRDTADNTDQLGDVYLVYDSNQVKDLRAKKFDRSSPNIFYQRGERRLGEFTTEPGAEGLDQAVIPGAERVSDRELVERRMREPMGPKANQRPLDFGLFGDETDKDQLSLFDDEDDGQKTVPVQGGLFQMADDVKASAARFGAGSPVATRIAEDWQLVIDEAGNGHDFASRAKERFFHTRALPSSPLYRSDDLRALLRKPASLQPYDLGIAPNAETVRVSFIAPPQIENPVVGERLFLPNDPDAPGTGTKTITLSVDDIFMYRGNPVYSPEPLRDAFKDLVTWYETQNGEPFEAAGLTLDVPALREFMKNSYATENGDKGGRPAVVYSGTRAGYFTTFDPPDERDKRRAVAWGSTDINVAATYSSLSKKFLTPDDANDLNSREWREGYAEGTYRADLEGDEYTTSIFDFGWRINYKVSPESFEFPPPPFTIDEWLDTLKEADYQEEAAQEAMIERYPGAENFVRYLAGAYIEGAADIVMSSENLLGIYPLVMNMENPLVVHAGKRKWNKVSLKDNEAFDAPGSTEDKDALRRRLLKELFGRWESASPEEIKAIDEKFRAAWAKTVDLEDAFEVAYDELEALEMGDGRIEHARRKLSAAKGRAEAARQEFEKIELELKNAGAPPPTSTSDIAYAAKELGFDGVIFRNVRDTADNSNILGDVFLVYDSKQVKDLRAEKFDPKSPNIFYQLGPSTEDKAAFEQAARGVAGVDMSGSAEAVEERKRDMRKIGEDLKDQVKGASTAGINVLEAEDAKDLNFLLRWLAPPGVWAKKFPAVHKVWRQGVKAEIDQSIYIQRMNREWDTITRPLSKAQFEQLTGLMFLGDAQETTFTDEDLDEFGVPAKVQTAYKGARRFIDKLGRWTEQHERNMKLDLVKRRSKLLREMATQRGMELQEFRKLYRARAALKESMRHGRGDPDDLAVKIEEADRKLHGRLREDMLGDETTAYFDMAEEADRLEVRLERTVIRKREGYVPHKFFGSWEIRSYQPDLADEAGASYERVGSEEGNFPSRLAAIRAARQYAKKHPDRKIVVLPREFQFPDSKATVLTQGSFDMLRNQVQDLMKVEGEELQDLMEGVARPRNRRRHAGFAQYRKGVPGFDKKLDRVIRAHIGEVVRYTTLDRLKYDAITMMEKEGLQRSRVTQERPELQKAVEAFLRDVNGQKQPVEEQVDTILNRPWATPLRVGLAAGGTAFLVAGGATTSVISGGLIGSYVGWRVAKSLASGGEFPSRAITAGMLSDMSHLKLGMVTNLMSALVNMTQTTLNTYPTLGARDTGAGIRRLQKALMSHVRGKPNKDWKILVKNDMNPAFGFNEGTKNQFQKESILSKMSMLAFTSAEGFNRSVAMLGAINRAERQGLSWGQAVQAGRRAAERTQFHYGPANKPELLRGNFLRVPLQFKNFIAQQMSFVLGLRGAEVPRFLLAMFLTAGALGIPGLDALDWLMEVMFDWSPIAAIKEGALEMAAKGELESGLGQLIARGMPGLGGIDISGRTGMGEKFLPMQIRDFTGPWISTVTSAARHAQEGAAITDQIRNLSPGLGNPLKAIEAAGAGGQMTSPWKRGRPEMVYSDAELIAKGVGARPVREAMEMDWREVNRIKLEKIRRDERRNVDRATAALKRGDRMGLIKIMREAQEAGIPIRASQLRSSMRGMQQQRAERTLRMLPRSLRGDAMELRRGLDRAAEGAAR